MAVATGINMSIIRNLLDAVQNNLISGDAYYIIAKSVIITFMITIIAWIVATGAGAIISYFMSYEKKILSAFFSAISFLCRSTPVLLLLLLMYYVVFKSININLTLLSGITIGLYGAGHFSEIIARQVRKAKEAQDEIVIRRLQQVYYTVTLPQTMEDTMFMTKRLAIQILQWTTVVGYITVNDLTEVMNRIGQRTMYPFFSIAVCIICYLIVTIVIETVFKVIERKIKK
jgi:ABC-type amino acid transport system permease subunit